MGRPKESLILEGQTMLARQVDLLRRVAHRVAVVGFEPGYLQDPGAPLIPDELPGRGPLGGVYTGLLRTHTEYNLFLGCDLPFVNQRLLGYIARCAIEAESDAVIPRSCDGHLQTLCAVYRRRACRAVRASLNAGENKVSSFFPKVNCQVIPWRDLARAGFLPSMFDNMNTPADYESARRRLEPSRARAE